MSNKADRAAFAPAQATAAASALDFDHIREELNRARAAGDVAAASDDEAATADAADKIADLSDKLIGIPMTDPAAIAEKVAAYAWLHNIAGHLGEPAQQWHIADHGSDEAKGLLAIYLDLTAAKAAKVEARAAWDKALAAHLEAKAKLDALTAAENGNGEDMSEEWGAASKAASATLTALLNTRAPDGAAMGLKARLIIEQNHIVYPTEDSPSNPAFISGLLADGWDERALAALYQDGLALEGVTGPVVDAQPDTFDGAAWLETVEAETGSRMVRSNNYSPAVHFEGGDAGEANARLAALRLAHADEVETVAYNRARQEAYAAAGPAPERIPSSPEELQGVFARGLLNVTPTDQQDAVRAALAALNITPAVWDSEKGGEQ